MAIKPVPPLTLGQYGNTGIIDTSQFSRTGSPYTDPDLFSIVMQQALNTSSFDILFGDNDDSSSSSAFGGSGVLESIPSNTDPLFGGLSGVNMPSDIAGQSTFYTGVSPQIEMIARSNLIGKTVTAVHPTTKENISGEVVKVSVSNGILLTTLNVSGTEVAVPPENLVSVSD